MDETAETINAQPVDFIELTADIVSAYVSKNSVRPSDMPYLLASIHSALTGLTQGSAPQAPSAEKLTPSQIRKSITPDALISFVDGKPYKTLKRHLSKSGMSIEQYRERYGLPPRLPFHGRQLLGDAVGARQEPRPSASSARRLPRRDLSPRRPSPTSRSVLSVGLERPRQQLKPAAKRICRFLWRSPYPHLSQR